MARLQPAVFVWAGGGVLGLGYRTGQAGGGLVYGQGAARAYAGGAGSAGASRPADRPGRGHDDDDD